MDPTGAPIGALGKLFKTSAPALRCPACGVMLGWAISRSGYLIVTLLVVTMIGSLVIFGLYPSLQNSDVAVVAFLALMAAWIFCYAKWGYDYRVFRRTDTRAP